MTRTARLLGIMLLLQGRRVVRAQDVADHFEISLRTVYRDMDALGAAGVPIAAEAGVGYSLVRGYHTGGRPDGLHDFGWLAGRWTVQHHRPARRLHHDHTWVDFDGTSVAWLTLGGYGNVDDNLVNLPSGPYHALTMRSYDPTTHLWSIWWLDARFPGRLDPPVVGHFEHGIGLFECDDSFEGRPIRVRFRWDASKPDHPKWEQSFSPDGGTTWEVNWRNEFTRVP